MRIDSPLAGCDANRQQPTATAYRNPVRSCASCPPLDTMIDARGKQPASVTRSLRQPGIAVGLRRRALCQSRLPASGSIHAEPSMLRAASRGRQANAKGRRWLVLAGRSHQRIQHAPAPVHRAAEQNADVGRNRGRSRVQVVFRNHRWVTKA